MGLTSLFHFDSIQFMNEFDNPDWNLAQVAAWVIYREAELVNQLADAGVHDFGAIGMYETMWPDRRQIHGTLDDLKISLRNGSIEAHGYHCDNPNKAVSVPKTAWADLHMRPPYAYRSQNLAENFQPWENIRVGSASVKAHWRSPLEVDGRTRYITAHIHELRDAAHECNQNLGHNELVTEIEERFQQRYPGKRVPSRSTIQRHLKKPA
jgi:hypothetical protein